MLQIVAPRTNAKPYSGPQTEDLDAWWTDPDFVLPRLAHQLENTAYLGEAMPLAFPVSTGLVAITAKYLGAPNVYIDRNTTWSSPIIDDWENLPPLAFDPENLWWKRSERLLNAGVRMIRDEGYEAFVGIPDLNGPTEVLAGLRGPECFAMDFYDRPEVIKPAVRRVQGAWFEAYRRSTAIAHQLGGYFCMMQTWSSRPMIDLQSDFSCLISTDMYQEYFLPFIVEQATAIERTIYHLDGPDAVRHVDALLAIDELDAIQWVQGAGGGRMSEWVDLLRRIQDGGKRVHIICESDEVELLSRSLDRSKLLLVVFARSQEEGESLLASSERTWGV